MKKVLIASRNPVKINATKKAFEDVFTDRFEFEGVSADSLVSDQPMSNDETLKGANNRIQNIQHLEADYFVSIEGGVDLLNNKYEAFAWIVVQIRTKLEKQKQQPFHCRKKFQIFSKRVMSLEMLMIWYLSALTQNKKMEQLVF